MSHVPAVKRVLVDPTNEDLAVEIMMKHPRQMDIDLEGNIVFRVVWHDGRNRLFHIPPELAQAARKRAFCIFKAALRGPRH
jgi:hypothetical protein